jgi:hypothetical protein
LPLPFNRSVKSFLSCGARAEAFPRLPRFVLLFFAPTEYPWVPLVRFCSAMASRPLMNDVFSCAASRALLSG